MPAVLPDSAKLRTVKAELERGLQPTRPAFLKWCIDKLSALPTQSADGINAALWADNVIDVCGEFPEDVLQSVTLDLLRSCTFRPSPAEIFKAADAKRGLRKRMLERVNLMLRGGAAPPREPPRVDTNEERLRARIWLGWKHAKAFNGSIMMNSARQAERELAEIEQREPASWSAPVVHSPEPAKGLHEEIQEIMRRPMTADQQRVAEARKQAALKELGLPSEPIDRLEWRDVPEVA